MTLPCLKCSIGLYWFKQRFANNFSYVARRHRRLRASRTVI